MRQRVRRALLGCCALLFALVTLLIVAPAATADESTKVLLVLDVSGSMNEKISSGGTKFAAAKRALKRVAAALPAGTQVGLRVYGSQIAEPKEQNPKACTDTKLVLPVGPLNQTKLNDAVDSLTAKGETPIAYSLGKSVEDLGDSGKRVVILISDGQETCKGDPCPTARKLAKAGVDLQFNAIGLAVNSTARKQLQCIVKAGDGNYYDADNTDDLENALRRMTQRALRPFQITGTPVKGTVGPDDAPQIGAGQYRDRFDPRGTELYYRINRTPGSTVTASIGTIVRPYPMQNVETWKLKLSTPDGEDCASTTITNWTWRAVNVLSGSVSSDQVDPVTKAGPDNPACTSSPSLVLSMSRQSALGNSDDVGVELLVSEEPEITNLAELPGPVDDGYTGTGSGVSAGKATSVLGGTSFSNSVEIEPGTVADSIAVGETVFYRVHLEPGQRLRATATAPAGKATLLANGEWVTTRVLLYAPDRSYLTAQQKNITANQTATVTAATPQVRVRNRELPVPSWRDPNPSAASIAGDYYVAVQLDPLLRNLSGRVSPVRLSVAVDGQPTGQPVHATAPTPSPSSAQSDPPSSGPSEAAPPAQRGTPGLTLGLLVTAAVIVAAGMVTAAIMLTRRKPNPPRSRSADPGR